MKSTVHPAEPQTSNTHTASDPVEVLGRLRLALRAEHKCERQGYDPYDTSRPRSPDVWSAKRKRA